MGPQQRFSLKLVGWMSASTSRTIAEKIKKGEYSHGIWVEEEVKSNNTGVVKVMLRLRCVRCAPEAVHPRGLTNGG